MEMSGWLGNCSIKTRDARKMHVTIVGHHAATLLAMLRRLLCTVLCYAAILNFVVVSNASITQTEEVFQQYCPNPAVDKARQMDYCKETVYSASSPAASQYLKALDGHSELRPRRSSTDILNSNPEFQRLISSGFLVDFLKELLKDVDSAGVCADSLEVLMLKLEKIVKFFDIIDIKAHKYKKNIINFFNSEDGLRDMKIENLHRFRVFKVSCGARSYVLKQLRPLHHKGVYQSDVLARHIDSPHIVKVLHVFKENIAPERSSIWYLAEYLDIDLGSEIAKENGIEVIRRATRDVLAGLKALHENRITHGHLSLYNTRGVKKVSKDGGFQVTFKLTGLDHGKYHHIASSSLEFGIKLDLEMVGSMLLWFNSEVEKINPNREKIEIQARHGGIYEFSVQDEKLIDFALLCRGYSENGPQSADELLDHPFITGDGLDIHNDRFGRRLYSRIK